MAIFDFGRTPEGVFYYAMEYLEGVNLEQLVTRHGPLPEARAVYLLCQVCGSLAEAHAAGLVHRDVKPANIFLTTRGGLRRLRQSARLRIGQGRGRRSAQRELADGGHRHALVPFPGGDQ